MITMQGYGKTGFGFLFGLLLFLAACTTTPLSTDRKAETALFSEDALSSAATVRVLSELEMLSY